MSWIPRLVLIPWKWSIWVSLNSQSSDCSVLFNCEVPVFYQGTLMVIGVVKEDCSFRDLKEFFDSCLYSGHRFARSAWAGEIHSTMMTKIQWSWHFFCADHKNVWFVHRTFYRWHFLKCLRGNCMMAKLKTAHNFQWSSVRSSHSVTRCFMLSLVIHKL